ncbi:MAG: hypothetical protein FWD48_00410 [Oscillospiraceae bacterium]|nr:hypothetical protein [Oscillospiraceae bacterium]
MKTAIIDRSLCGVIFKEITSKTDVYTYVLSLKEAGADYVELDLNALLRLPEPMGAENYIFRVEQAYEHEIANAFPFSYAVLPLKFAHLIEKLQIPVILEIKTGDADIPALLKVVAESIDLTKIALLRLVGDFNKHPDEFKSILAKVRMRYAVPFDVCPLNTTLCALSAAVTAYEVGIDSLTLNFGNSNNFTPLEEFLISMATIHKVTINRNYISGICKASVMSSLICEIETTNLQKLMKRYQLSPQRVEVADGQPLNLNPWKGKKHQRRSLIERRLDYMEVEDDLSQEIMTQLKKCGVDFFANDKKDSYLN